MTKAKQKKNAIHAIALLLLVAGMGAGYYWMPVLGFILEIVIWIYGGIFIDSEQNDEKL